MDFAGGSNPALVASGVSAAFWQHMITLAQNHFAPRRIYLFGSRSRGTHRRTSDIDLAFEFDPSAIRGFNAFCAIMEDEAQTLLAFDLVDLNSCSEPLRADILLTGKVIHED
jgi:predicted nucleotidyltransferase